MVLLAVECFSPPLIPELPENQAAISSRNEPITSQVRAGCAKKLAQSPQARMVRASWTITLMLEMMMMRRLTIQNSREKGAKNAEDVGRARGSPKDLRALSKPRRCTSLSSSLFRKTRRAVATVRPQLVASVLAAH